MSALPLSATQTERHELVTDRYTHINTETIVNKLLDAGFIISDTAEARVRKESNVGFQKHIITMQNDKYATDEGVPTIAIRNSHNRSTGLALYSGFIRYACLNMLVFGSDIEELKMQHKRNWEADVDAFIMGYEDKVVRSLQNQTKMEQKRMSSYDEKLFTKAVAQLRYPLEDYMDYRELSRVNRVEDRGDSLWLCFNRVQENILKGDFERRIITESEDLGKVESWGKAKIITNTDELLRINRGVHDIAMNFA